MLSPERYTVTAALIYANGPIHIGHLAGCYLPADIYVRYLRACGKDVAFISGTDEHGVPITLKARKEGKTPQEVVDHFYGIIKQSFEDFGISFDIYSRTSSPHHHQVASDFFLKLYNDGVFTEEVSEQYYDAEASQFLADRYIMGTCPNCSNENAYGDQCERCGSTLSPKELINPRSTLSGSVPELRTTRNWSLPLDKLQPALETYIASHPEWKSNVSGQCRSWLQQGLQPRAMTRDLDWGVKVPVEGADGKVLYVWFDAPIGYITFTQEWAQQQGKPWEPYWMDDKTQIVHFIGKDNIVFHCLIFPAMLMTHGGYALADNVPAMEFMNLEGDKISTSRDWAVWLHEYLEEFPGQQDVLRYALCSAMPETKDNDFTWADFQARNNNELVAILGNFVNRVLVLTQKYFDGKVPAANTLSAEDQAVLQAMSGFPHKIGEAIDQYRFREALGELMNLARLGNKYLADAEPWKLIKTDEAAVASILHVALQLCASLSSLMEPFMPFTAKKLADMLAHKPLAWAEAGRADQLVAGHQLGQAGLLFSKVEDSVVQQQTEKLQARKAAREAAQQEAPVNPLKETIQYDDFGKMDLRVGTVLEAEKVAKTKKLLKLLVDTGVDQRVIVSGIAEYYTPESLVGQQVLVLANLAPRALKGIDSHGMLLMAEDSDGSLRLMQPQNGARNGSVVA